MITQETSHIIKVKTNQTVLYYQTEKRVRDISDSFVCFFKQFRKRMARQRIIIHNENSVSNFFQFTKYFYSVLSFSIPSDECGKVAISNFTVPFKSAAF